MDGIAPGQVADREISRAERSVMGRVSLPPRSTWARSLSSRARATSLSGGLTGVTEPELPSGRTTGLSPASARRASGLMYSASMWTLPPSR